jgi:hypothetical protein
MTLLLSVVEAGKLATFAPATGLHHHKRRQDRTFPPPVFITTNILVADKRFLPQRQQQQTRVDWLLATSYWLPAISRFAIAANSIFYSYLITHYFLFGHSHNQHPFVRCSS